MVVQFSNIPEGTKILELGGGSNRHPQAQVNVDVRQVDGVDFVVDFESADWPITDSEWDVVFSHFAMEHISYLKIPQFLKEVLRILKPGGRAVIITANTEAQIKWLQNNPLGWDNESPFVSCSKILFGSQDYGANAHKSYFSPEILLYLFQEAGFTEISTTPYGARGTDIAIEAHKPTTSAPARPPEAKPAPLIASPPAPKILEVKPVEKQLNHAGLSSEERAKLFDRHYFDGGTKVGGYPPPGYLDFPHHEITARYVLARKPKTVYELGCGRGYVLKRLQDHGVTAAGADISKHCFMTRVANGIETFDPLTTSFWKQDHHDLVFSIGFLEHVPEELLPDFLKKLADFADRGLHGVSFTANGFDKTQCTIRPQEWWAERLPKDHEVYAKEDLEAGQFPSEASLNDGKLKISVGGFTTMFHYNWLNLDAHPLEQYAQQNGYRFQRFDARQGLPFKTGEVDFILLPLFLQRLSYTDGLAFLRDCRRVIKPHGVMRLSVPDAGWLIERCYYKTLAEFADVNDDVAKATSETARLWALLHAGHSSAYDEEALRQAVESAGFEYEESSFRMGLYGREHQILHETLDLLPCLGLYANACPAT